MSSKRMIMDDAVAEEPSQCNVDHFADGHVHPRVTAKKTFFNLHRHRRRNDAEASESDTNFHPRIQWSAGTTNIGSGYQIGTYDDSVTRDIMKPVLQREPSTPDPASTFTVSKSHLPPVPDTWGSMDAQPTQPEEIQHLLEPSPVIPRTQVLEKVVKPKRKFREKFRKHSNAAVFDMTSFASSRTSEDGVETVKPEEEFKFLNERYARDGIIPAESSTKKDTAGPTSSQTRFGFKKGKKPNLKTSIHARRSHEQEIATPGTSFDYERPIGHPGSVENDRKTLKRESFHGKRVTIDTDTIEYLSPEESSTSPLPARRSCEPLDVNNLRKLRESEPEPGPSGFSQRDREFPERNTSVIVDTVFATRPPKISNYDAQSDDVIPRSDSEDSLLGIMKEEACNVDSFKIDNPFSDFSLQNINRDKGLLRQHAAETAIKTAPRYHDPAQPSTSKAAYAMEIYRQKVSRSESVKQPKKKSREQSFLKSAVSRMKKASFLDKAVMVNSSQRIFDAIAKSLIPKNGSKEQEDQSGYQFDKTFGVGFLYAIIQQLSGNISKFACIGLQNDQDDFGREKMVFNCHDRNLRDFLAPLMEYMINPTFDHFLKNYPSTSSCRLFERSFEIIPVMPKNGMWSDIISFFQTAWPKAINHVVDVSQIRHKNMPSVYSEVDETGTVCDVSKLLQGRDDRKNASLPPIREDRVQFVTVQSDELVDKITEYVINIVLSQDLFREFLFLSFSPMPALIPIRRNFEGSYLSGLENYWRLTVSFFGTPIVGFLNLYETCNYQKPENLERFCLAVIGNTMRKLHFTYI